MRINLRMLKQLQQAAVKNENLICRVDGNSEVLFVRANH